MELTALMTPPVMGLAAVLALLAIWIGYALGRSNENKRGSAALGTAEAASRHAIETLTREGQERLDVLNKANGNEIEKIKQANTQQVERLTQAHQTLVESVRATHATELERQAADHSALIDRLNAANNAAAAELESRRKDELREQKGEHQAAMQELKREHQAAVEALHEQQRKVVEQMKEEVEWRRREIEQRNADKLARREARVAELEAEQQRVEGLLAERELLLKNLREDIKEAKLKNMFSVSKSGEKLIRVVRSVQELASELDETSRTVTDGEYSFFDQIKDRHDRETVLNLAGSAPAASDEGAPEPPAEAANAPEADDDGFGAWLDSGEEGAPATGKAPH